MRDSSAAAGGLALWYKYEKFGNRSLKIILDGISFYSVFFHSVLVTESLSSWVVGPVMCGGYTRV